MVAFGGTIMFNGARVIFAASPPFLLLITMGCALATMASVLSILTQTSDICTAKTWLGHISFHFVFGAVFAKTCIINIPSIPLLL